MSKSKIIDLVYSSIENEKQRSAWNKGVTLYALEILENMNAAISDDCFTLNSSTTSKEIEKTLLNGASDWYAYSWGGSALIYDSDIAERLCTPSELKKTRGGERRPNSREEWLDTQARALSQTCNRIRRHIRKILREA